MVPLGCVSITASKKGHHQEEVSPSSSDELFDQLQGVIWLTKIDLRSDYHELKISESYTPKIVSRLVMFIVSSLWCLLF